MRVPSCVRARDPFFHGCVSVCRVFNKNRQAAERPADKKSKKSEPALKALGFFPFGEIKIYQKRHRLLLKIFKMYDRDKIWTLNSNLIENPSHLC